MFSDSKSSVEGMPLNVCIVGCAYISFLGLVRSIAVNDWLF